MHLAQHSEQRDSKKEPEVYGKDEWGSTPLSPDWGKCGHQSFERAVTETQPSPCPSDSVPEEGVRRLEKLKERETKLVRMEFEVSF